MGRIAGQSGRQEGVWVVGPFTSFALSAEGGRFVYVADQACLAGARVTFFTSRFDHYTKRRKLRPVREGIRIVLVFEPGYRSNISLGRVLSHLVFDVSLLACAVWTALRRGRPRSIYCPLPHNLGALLLGLLAKVMGCRFVIDVHDTWPESLLSVHRVRAHEAPFFHLWRCCADLALRLADTVFAESRRYAERADRVRLPYGLSPAICVYLGGDLEYYRRAGRERELPPAVARASLRYAYVGSLGRNYDLELVVRAFRRLQDRHPGAHLVFLGGGELETRLRTLAGELGVRAWFSGFLPHTELVGLLRRMDYGLNTFAARGNVAFSYKLNDYLLAGLPVLNALEGEVWEVVERCGLGYNYRPGDPDDLVRALERAIEDPVAGEVQRRNVRAFAATHLDRRRIYAPILEELLR
jgi:glycosyltransferase involved in cell wall biosynthesis